MLGNSVILVRVMSIILQSSGVNRDRENSTDLLLTSINHRGSTFNYGEILGQSNPVPLNRAKIQIYYESMCPECRKFVTTQLRQVVSYLFPYIHIQLYPYGLAEMKKHDGHVQFTCQNGPAECYGNKLHACAIDFLGNMYWAVMYKSCLKDFIQTGNGSDDAAVDMCSSCMPNMPIDPERIKTCVNGPRGDELLEFIGKKTKEGKPPYVPYVLINGVESKGEFKADVCKVIKNPPKFCANAIQVKYYMDHFILN